MEWIENRTAIWEFLKKYRYIFLVLLAGFLLLMLPENVESEAVSEPISYETAPDMEVELSKILASVSGAGRVEVLLSEKTGEETVFQSNENRSQNSNSADMRTDTVLVTDAQRNETGLVKQINPPSYLGAIIVCEGADNATVQLSLVEAVGSVTGLTSDRITVLKMK